MTNLSRVLQCCVLAVALTAVTRTASAGAPIDLNADGKSEVVWENMSTGHSYVWSMNGLQVASEGVLPAFGDSNWRLAGLGDANGDGKADLLWRNTVTGENYLWTMNGLAVLTQGPLPSLPMAWRVVGFADVNGDGLADVIWRNTQTGENYVWTLKAATVTSEGPLPTVPLQWTVAAVGDVNADGRADIFWRNATSGDNYLWTLNGFAVASETALQSMPAVWQLAGTGDYNADGKADVIWRNGTTGENYAWFMDGTLIGAQGYLPTVADVNWKMTAFGDYNGDGRADILWRHGTSGQNYVWLMNGATLISDGFLPAVSEQAWTSRIDFPTQAQTAQAAAGGSAPSGTAGQAASAVLGSSPAGASSASGSGSAATPTTTTLPASASKPSSAGSNVCVTSAGGGSFDLCFNNTENLSATRMLTFKVNNGSRTVDLSGDLTLAGGSPLTLNTTGPTTVTLPQTGTLATTSSVLPVAGGAMTGTLIAPEIRIETNNVARLRMRDTLNGEANAFWDTYVKNHSWGRAPAVNDYVYTLAFNESGALLDQPMVGFNIEPRYVGTNNVVVPPNGALEHNWTYTSIDRTVSYRPHQFGIDLNTHKAEFRWQADKAWFFPSNGVESDAPLYIHSPSKSISTFGVNIGVQSNVLTYPLRINSIAGAAALGIDPANPPNNTSFINIQPTGTSPTNVYGVTAALRATNQAQNVLQNTGTGAANLQVTGGSGTSGIQGDAYIVMSPANGAQNWVIGGDRSASNGFAIGASHQLGANDAIRITAALRTSFMGAVTHMSYTVAGLPSAGGTTAPAGTVAYASNGRKSGEGVGAGTGIPVWSDGTNWRTYYDNTVVAQ
jgi:hypothetical protein